jgi:hypothetical protein
MVVKRAFLMVLLSAACGDAMAGWIRIGGNEYVGTYVDLITMRKTGSKVKMATLVDFKTVITNGGYPRKSSRSEHEYDCKENKWRLLGYSYHSGNMGKGEAVYSENEQGSWQTVMPGSEAQARWDAACGRRQALAPAATSRAGAEQK